MITKAELGYCNLFEKLLEMINNYEPKQIIIDFERGLINSIATSFPSSKVYGCNFHFGQMIWRRIHGSGLSGVYKSQTWQRGIIRKCFHLAFIPVSHVLMEFERICHEASTNVEDESLLNFLIYFRKNFVAGEERPEPAFNVSFWSCYDRVISSVQRTTNTLEGWHRALNSSFNRSHPNLAAFVEVLRREEQRMYFNLTQIKNGLFLDPTEIDFKKEYHLKILCGNFKNFNIDSFFKLIDKLMTFKTE